MYSVIFVASKHLKFCVKNQFQKIYFLLAIEVLFLILNILSCFNNLLHGFTSKKFSVRILESSIPILSHGNRAQRGLAL